MLINTFIYTEQGYLIIIPFSLLSPALWIDKSVKQQINPEE